MRKYNVPAVEKTIKILDLLASSENELSVTEIHTALDIPKATTFMILNVLEDNELVAKNSDGRYTIGVRLYNLGMAYMTKLDLKNISMPYLEELAKQTGYTSHLGILVQGRVMFVGKVEHNSFIKFSTFEGMRSDLHISSLGKAIAAHLPDDTLQSILTEHGMGRYTPNTITSVETFREALSAICEVGYSIEDEEGEIGVRCVGSPIFNHKNEVVAAVSITALRSELLYDLIPKVGANVKSIATKISQQLGWTDKKADQVKRTN